MLDKKTNLGINRTDDAPNLIDVAKQQSVEPLYEVVNPEESPEATEYDRYTEADQEHIEGHANRVKVVERLLELSITETKKKSNKKTKGTAVAEETKKADPKPAKTETKAIKDEPKVKNEPKAKDEPKPEKPPKRTEQEVLDTLKSEAGKPRIRWNVNTAINPVVRVINYDQIIEATSKELNEIEKRWKRTAERGGVYMNLSNPMLDPADSRNPDYPTLNNHLRGMEQGIICIAGAPNIGKTVLLSNIMHDIYKFNDGKNGTQPAIILDFILDDAISNRYVHLASMKAQRRYQDIKMMSHHQDPEIRQECTEALAYAKSVLTSGRFWSFERILSTVTESGVLSYSVSKLQNLCGLIKSMREAFPAEDYPMVAFIDAYNNVDNTGIPGCASDFAKEERAIDLLEEAANGLNVILFMTTHLRKDNNRRIMSLEGIKGSLKLPYQAKVTFYLHNDLKALREASNVFWKDGENGRFFLPKGESEEHMIQHRPVLEVHNLKSKVAEESRPLYYWMAPERCMLYTPKDLAQYESVKTLASTAVVD